LDYIDGADLIANKAIEQIILWPITIVWFRNHVPKKRRNLTVGFPIHYQIRATNSRKNIETGINNGQWYNSVYDKLHIAITSSYNLNEKWSFELILPLQTGQPVTYPVGQYD
jgi:hypothetical protein